MSAEQAAKRLGIRSEIGRGLSSSLCLGQKLKDKRVALDGIPKKPMSEAGASSNAPDASASTPMGSPSVTAVPL